MQNDVVLVIDQSQLIRSFLKNKLIKNNFEVYVADNGREGLRKMKTKHPDLVIIDYAIVIDEQVNFIKEREDKILRDIPVIMLGNELNIKSLLKVAKFNTFKFFTKPIKMDKLLEAISRILHRELKIDATPCNIDVRLNEDILFIEVANGLNNDKIDSLKYRIEEIKMRYNILEPKVLLMLVDLIHDKDDDLEKLYALMSSIIRYGTGDTSSIVVLSASQEIKEILNSENKYSKIFVAGDIDSALEKLNTIKVENLFQSEDTVQGIDELYWSNDGFVADIDEDNNTLINRQVRMAVVDDDDLILSLVKAIFKDMNWEIKTYPDGKYFLLDMDKFKPDILLLDLMMPEITGFEVLNRLKRHDVQIKTLVFSSLTQVETVKRVMAYGIKSYIVKPFHPDLLLKKVNDIIESSF